MLEILNLILLIEILLRLHLQKQSNLMNSALRACLIFSFESVWPSIELLDDLNLKHGAYRNKLYKEENKKLHEILELVFSNGTGKENGSRTGGHLW